MKAIILAAGYGQRMQPLTHTTHKTMLTISGRSIIQWIIDALLVNKIEDIAIVTGYLADELKTYLRQAYPQLTIEYIHNERFAETNNIYSMSMAIEQLNIDDDVILVECDLIFKADVIQKLLDSPYPNVALVDHFQQGMDGTVVTIDDDVITDVIAPQRQGIDFSYTDKYKTLNIYRFSQEFCNGPFRKLLTYYATTINENAYYEVIIGLLIYLQHEIIHAVIIDDEQWAEIDDPNDLKMATYQFNPTTRQTILDKSYGGFWQYDVLDFCYIRNMYFPTEAMLTQMSHNLPNLLHNYGSTQALLNRKLAYFLCCREANVTLLNGLSQIYPILTHYFKGSRVLIPTPSFGEYNRTFPEATTYDDEMDFDLDEIANQAQTHDVIVFVNPNNPTGTLIPTLWLHQFATAHPGKTIIVDESFIDFSPEPSLLPLLEKQPLANVILMQSLSKSLGVPGLRLGFVYATNSDFNTHLQERMPIWNMNAVAEYFLELLLKNRKALGASFEQTAVDRQELAENLEALPLVDEVYLSGGNFLLVSLDCLPAIGDEIASTILLKHNIYLKNLSSRFGDEQTYFRLAVRLPHENKHLVDALYTVIEQLIGEKPYEQQMAHYLAEEGRA